MLSSHAAFVAVLALSACSGDDPTNLPDPPQTGTTAETGADDTAPVITGEDWQVRNHDGSVVLYRNAVLKPGDDGFAQVYAVFGDDLNGVGTGQWCVETGVCVNELPQRVGDFVDLEGYVRQTEVDYDWVGERVTIGNDPTDWIEVPFQYVRPETVADGEYGFYRGKVSRFDNDEIPPFGVRFAGEWGENIEVVDELGIPVPIQPRLSTPVGNSFTPAPVVTFDWTWPPDPPKPEPPIDRGDTPLYLRVRSNELDRIYRLPMEGPYELQLDTLGLNPSSNLTVSFGRWSRTTARVNANDLTVYGVIETTLTTPACPLYPNVNAGQPPTLAPEPEVPITYIGVGFDGLMDGGRVRDYRWDSAGVGTPTDVSSKLVFTLYDGAKQPLCTVQYDASSAVRVTTPWPSNTGARINEAYTIDLSQGVSDCNRIQPGVLGTTFTDIRQALEAFEWDFGFGEIGATAEPLSQAYGAEWDTVNGQTWGFFVKRTIDPEALEVSAGFAYHLEDCATLDPTLTPLQYRPGPLKSGVYSPVPVLLFDAVPPEPTTTTTTTTGTLP